MSKSVSTTSPLPAPSLADDNGRTAAGRFAMGNKAGRGNPLAVRVQRLRVALVRTVTAGDLQDVVRALLAAAKGGDIQAAKLLFDRTLGPAAALDVELRLTALEQGESP